MTAQELKELDVWIAELMEKKPESIPLHRVRKYNDDRFNYARQLSDGGWWITNTGSDAEDKRGINTPCVWYPSSNVASEPGEVESQSAAMLVLEKCAEAGCWPELRRLNRVEPIGAYVWYHPATDADCEAPNLPLAIAMFAKQVFEK